MKSLLRSLRRFLAAEDGPTAVEYAVMLMLIIAVCIVSITAIGQDTKNMFSSVAQSSALSGS